MREALLMGMLLSMGAAGGCSSGFDRIAVAAGRNDSIVLRGEGGARVLVSPRLQGRILTSRVGSIESVGFVNLPEILEGEGRPFNNFGGQDRFWLGPEAGQFGIYFDPGSELRRDLWKVPADFNRGPFQVLEKGQEKVVLGKEISVVNYSGTRFRVSVRREIGLVPPEKLPAELGASLPAGVGYTGSYSDNSLTNASEERWSLEKGLVNIWILGQFEPGPETVIIAPFRPGEGLPYRDEPYFGKVPADRLKILESAVLFRADARKEGKVAMPQMRTTGLAGSFDFRRKLLVVIKFDVPASRALYGDSTWLKQQPNPYAGDLFQTYNSDAGDPPGRNAFYEIESVSPSLELAPRQSVRHRHATYCFQGDYEALATLARQILGVDLAQVRRTMFPALPPVER